jgi:transcriptional regulator with XRE-family HTH domain
VSDLTDSQRRQLWAKFGHKQYRDAFVASHLSTNISAQIHATRERLGWTQTQLADAAGMAQARISVMEDPSYERSSISTLKRLASAFDVALIVQFVPFSDFLVSVTCLTPNHFAVPDFSHDLPPDTIPYGAGTGAGTITITQDAPTATSTVVDLTRHIRERMQTGSPLTSAHQIVIEDKRAIGGR